MVNASFKIKSFKIKSFKPKYYGYIKVIGSNKGVSKTHYDDKEPYDRYRFASFTAEGLVNFNRITKKNV